MVPTKVVNHVFTTVQHSRNIRALLDTGLFFFYCWLNTRQCCAIAQMHERLTMFLKMCTTEMVFLDF